MASDRRWTGGIANRDWSSGHPIGRVINHDRIKADVATYLADCAAHRSLLSSKYHPTADSFLKVVYHQGAQEAAAIRDEYQRQAAASD